MELKSSNILITGGTGSFGRFFVQKLLDQPNKYKRIVIYSRDELKQWELQQKYPKKNYPNLRFFLGDIRDPYCVKEAMKGCDFVYHLAALIGIPYSYIAPASYVDTNIKGTLNIVQAARDLEIEKVIHTSTSETYGTAQFVPINENHPLVGQSPYAASKIGADHIALSYYKSFGTPITILRPFNTYGPRQSSRAVIPTIITQIVSDMKIIKLGDLSPTRDFNFVEDTCNAFKSIAKSKETIGKVVNVASNFEVSIMETAKLISEIMNVEIEIISENERIRPKDSEVNRLFGDNNLLKKLTDWEPKFSGINGFKDGLQITVEWFSKKENLNIYKANSYAI